MESFLTIVFGRILTWCYSLLKNYWFAIILFTLLSKIFLIPLSIWVHRNSIKLVKLMPEINQIKIKYFGDKEKIGEEQQYLYKRERYNAFASIIPLFIQILVLMGLIGAIRSTTQKGSSSLLSAIPSEAGGISLLIPLSAGLSATFLSLFQNRNNPLQKEQNQVSQMSTNGLSILISLVLGIFVPVGVGFYWIFSNLFTILQQLFLNAVIPPRKYIDYNALYESNQKLLGLNNIGGKKSLFSINTKREKEDYKRFFSVLNKHLVFYSESSGFYKYFENTIEELLKRSNIIIHYITSDPNDIIFETAKNQSRIKPYYISEKKLITLMMKMDSDMVVMTMPDLNNFHIKRSYVRKDIEYVYMFHGLFTGMRTLRKGALDHFDTLLCTGKFQMEEARALEKKYKTPEKNLIPCGYGLIDNMANAFEQIEKHKQVSRTILIAPSWQEENILESCLGDLVDELLNAGYDITVRPHPQYMKRNPQKFEEIVSSLECHKGDRFRFQTDFSSNETVFLSDLLITDWSSIGFEYAIATKKPAIFINTPMKVVNDDLTVDLSDTPPLDIRLRDIVGKSIELIDVRNSIVSVANELMNQRQKYLQKISDVRENEIFNFGESGKYSAQYILDKLKKKGQSKHDNSMRK